MILAAVLALLATSGPSPIEARLSALATDYRSDPRRLTAMFEVRVDGNRWTVTSEKDKVSIRRGPPPRPTFAFVMDRDTFDRVSSGRMNALTAMGQARASDPSPMRLEVEKGYKPGPNFRADFLSVAAHFWTTGRPEIVSFGFSHARTVHGGEAVPTYYAPGFRGAWYGLLPGQHVNAFPADQVNDFDTLFVVIEAGSARARIAGVEVPLTSRTSIHVPAGATHEFWNPGSRPAEMIMVAYGPKA